MEQTFSITGLHCMGCVARVQKALEPLADEVSVTLEPPQVVIEAPEALSLEEVQAAVAKAGDYRVALQA